MKISYFISYTHVKLIGSYRFAARSRFRSRIERNLLNALLNACRINFCLFQLEDVPLKHNLQFNILLPASIGLKLSV